MDVICTVCGSVSQVSVEVWAASQTTPDMAFACVDCGKADATPSPETPLNREAIRPPPPPTPPPRRPSQPAEFDEGDTIDDLRLLMKKSLAAVVTNRVERTKTLPSASAHLVATSWPPPQPGASSVATGVELEPSRPTPVSPEDPDIEATASVRHMIQVCDTLVPVHVRQPLLPRRAWAALVAFGACTAALGAAAGFHAGATSRPLVLAPMTAPPTAVMMPEALAQNHAPPRPTARGQAPISRPPPLPDAEESVYDLETPLPAEPTPTAASLQPPITPSRPEPPKGGVLAQVVHDADMAPDASSEPLATASVALAEQRRPAPAESVAAAPTPQAQAPRPAPRRVSEQALNDAIWEAVAASPPAQPKPMSAPHAVARTSTPTWLSTLSSPPATSPPAPVSASPPPAASSPAPVSASPPPVTTPAPASVSASSPYGDG
ncbi:hypothetical protein [Chondromyces crocatus]|uniref:Uncharacterized protein n=1 Tax=Chondromyces crocatus TaxID=52 RepID=A0A0K1EBP3_CHOCO|nr:hypothetical protein [Chondromyces crocatus]AKT38082.1 uncharacterized protein CMC5_022240 [Chondromyces crocatus]